MLPSFFDSVLQLIVRTSTDLPPDVRAAMKTALGSEAVGPMKLWPVSDLSQAVVALHNMRQPPAPRQVGLTLAPPVTLP